jgi:uncharacterized membrane protein
MRSFLGIAALATLGFAGCNDSPKGGTPGTSSTFSISAPTLTTTIKQGDTQTVKLTLNRGSDFKQTVDLSVTAPDKITAKLNKTSVPASDTGKDVDLSISVAKDAPLGDQVVKVTGTPQGGTATSVDVKIKVEHP